MHIRRLTILTLGVALSGAGTRALHAQTTTSSTSPNQLQVVAVVGCVAQEGSSLILTRATGPMIVPVAGGKAQSGSGVTVDAAKSQPVGKERYRLINMLDEFGVANHKGHKVLAKGLITGDAKERRINLVSFEMVDANCR